MPQPDTIAFCSLPDGRRLAYTEYGDPRGHPTLYFHGFPGSRLEAQLADASAAQAQVRLIAIDRPGFGGSDYQAHRSLMDWPADVACLADALQLGQFTVVGVSGGAPYAAACARQMPQRLDALGMVSGIAPLNDAARLHGMLLPNRWTLKLARRWPRLLRAALRPAGLLMKYQPGVMITLLARRLPAPDCKVLTRPRVQQILTASLAESLRTGTRGHACELSILTRPWGFEIADITVPVLLWHGRRDRIIPVAHAHYLHQTLPRSSCRVFAAEAHFSLAIDHISEILDELRAARHQTADSATPPSTR